MSGDPVQHTCATAWGSILPPPPCLACQPGTFTFTPIPSAWECIRCHRINAPHVSSCACPGEVTITITSGEHG